MLLWAAVLHAQPPAAGSAPVPERPLAELMEVDPGATCLELQRLSLRIARWRERDSADARIHVHVQGDAHSATRIAFTVTVQGGGHAERTIADAPNDCNELHSAVALSVALAIDATLNPGNPTDPVVDIPTPPEPAAPAPRLPTPRPEKSAPASRHGSALDHLEIALLGGATTGLLTDVTLAFGPRLSYSPNAWLHLAAVGFATTLDRQVLVGARGHFDTQLLAGGVDACLGGEIIEHLQLMGCTGLRAGTLTALGQQYPTTAGAPEPWVAVAASLQLRAWVASWAGLGVAVEGIGPVARHEILLRGRGVPDRRELLPPVGLATTIGPVFRFF